jgi:hypothetical protein
MTTTSSAVALHLSQPAVVTRRDKAPSPALDAVLAALGRAAAG